jgi:hypothetical protein
MARVLGGPALAVLGPLALVALPIPFRALERLDELEPFFAGRGDEAFVVGEVVAPRSERREVGGRGLAPPVALAEEDVTAWAHEPRERSQRGAVAVPDPSRADGDREVGGLRLELDSPRVLLAESQPGVRDAARCLPPGVGEEVGREIDAHGADVVALEDAEEQLALATAEVDDACPRCEGEALDEGVDLEPVERVLEGKPGVGDRRALERVHPAGQLRRAARSRCWRRTSIR